MTKQRLPLVLLLLVGLGLLGIGCAHDNPLVPEATSAVTVADVGSDVLGSDVRDNDSNPRANEKACWGQASMVFARMGAMGEHSSQFPTPRLGLRNLARSLHDQGVLPDDTMQALGAFVAQELGLTIDACL